VAGLEPEDFDWRPGAVAVRGKAGRRDRMPLAAEVGEAVADYLRQARALLTRR
jgi:integrase/recombinase XerD